MAQKNAAPNHRQAQIIRYRGLDPKYYTVVRELNFSLFIQDRRDKTIKIIDKIR